MDWLNSFSILTFKQFDTAKQRTQNKQQTIALVVLANPKFVKLSLELNLLIFHNLLTFSSISPAFSFNLR